MSDRAIFKEMKDFIYLTAVVAGYLLSSSEGYSVEMEVRKREIGLLMASKSDDKIFTSIKYAILYCVHGSSTGIYVLRMYHSTSYDSTL
jgi:hypothetical protein